MTKYTQKYLLALALAATLAAPLAMAQGASPATDTNQAPPATNPSAVQDTLKKPSTSLSNTSPGQKTWEELDANKDGKLSKAEADADASMKALFAKADADGDGTLTPEEYRAYYEKNVAKSSH